MAKYQKVVIDQSICISCGACVAACPHEALEMDDDGKIYLIWDKCKDAFDCIEVCPVSAIFKTSEAPEKIKNKKGWIKFSKKLSEKDKKEFEQWKKKFGIKA
jgi:ferredoxin